jgi:hypothetical protein
MNRFIKKKSRINAWWLGRDIFWDFFNCESIYMRISILKIILLFALEENSTNNRIRLSYEEIGTDTNLQKKMIEDSIIWLIRNDILFPYMSEGNAKLFFLNHYRHDGFTYGVNAKKWVELSNQEILRVLKNSSNSSICTINRLKKFLIF